MTGEQPYQQRGHQDAARATNQKQRREQKWFTETEYAKGDTTKNRKLQQAKNNTEAQLGHEKNIKIKKKAGLNIKAKHRGMPEATRGEA